MLPLSVNVFKKFVVFWVESKIALFIWKRPFWSILELIWKQSLLEKICSVVCEYFVSRSCEAMITSNEKENHRTGVTNQFSVYLCCWWCDNCHAIKFCLLFTNKSCVGGTVCFSVLWTILVFHCSFSDMLIQRFAKLFFGCLAAVTSGMMYAVYLSTYHERKFWFSSRQVKINYCNKSQIVFLKSNLIHVMLKLLAESCALLLRPLSLKQLFLVFFIFRFFFPPANSCCGLLFYVFPCHHYL